MKIKTDPVTKLADQLIGSRLRIGKSKKIWFVRRSIVRKIVPSELGYVVAIIYVPMKQRRLGVNMEEIETFNINGPEAEKMLVRRDYSHILDMQLVGGKVLKFTIPAKSPEFSLSE